MLGKTDRPPCPLQGRHSEVILQLPDRIIAPAKAREVTEAAIEAGVGCAWILMHDDAEHPGAVVARFATTTALSIYVMVADDAAELRAMLPPVLIRSQRQPGDPEDVVEIWFSPP